MSEARDVGFDRHHRPEVNGNFRPGSDSTTRRVEEPYSLDKRGKYAREDRFRRAREVDNVLRTMMQPTSAIENSDAEHRSNNRSKKNELRNRHVTPMHDSQPGRVHRADKMPIHGKLQPPRGEDDYKPESRETCLHKTGAELERNPVMKGSDYKNRDTAMAEVILKHMENPDAVGLEDLKQIIAAEEEDLVAKQVAMGFRRTNPIQADWLGIELKSIRTAREAVGRLIIGQKMDHNDPLAMTLNNYVVERLDLMKSGRDNASFAKLDDESLSLVERAAASAIPVFETLFEKTLKNGKDPKSDFAGAAAYN